MALVRTCTGTLDGRPCDFHKRAYPSVPGFTADYQYTLPGEKPDDCEWLTDEQTAGTDWLKRIDADKAKRAKSLRLDGRSIIDGDGSCVAELRGYPETIQKNGALFVRAEQTARELDALAAAVRQHRDFMFSPSSMTEDGRPIRDRLYAILAEIEGEK